MQEYTPLEVIDELKAITDTQTDAALAEALGLSRQNINQFKKGTRQDIKMRMIAVLLEELKKRGES